MKLWIAFVSRIFKVAEWKSYLCSILWKAQLPREGHKQDVVAGSSPVHGRDNNFVNTPVLETCLDATSRLDDVGFELERVLSLISSNEKVRLEFGPDSLEVSTIEGHDRYGDASYSRQVLVNTFHLNHDVSIQIARAIETSRTLIEISLNMYNRPEEAGIVNLAFEEIGNAIRSNQRIEKVQIVGGSCVSLDEIVMKCSLILLESQKLKELAMRSGVGLPLGRSAIESFDASLRRTRTLRGMAISTRHPSGWIDTEGLKLLLEPFMGGEESDHSVGGLGLNGAGIDDEGAKVVASVLRHNTCLIRGLSLHGNKIGPTGSSDIAAALRSNTSLKTLYMSQNPLGAGGLSAIVASLTTSTAKGNLETCNSFLKSLCLRDEIGREGIEHLEALVRENTSLVYLDLGQCSLLETTDNFIRLLEALKSNKNLKAVNVSDCLGVVGRRVLGTIFDLLQVNHSLEELDLGGTPLEADGGAQMVRALLERKVKDKMWEVLEGMATVRPNSARIFLCGYPFAGKTTLRQTIMRRLKLDRGMNKWRNRLHASSLLSRMIKSKSDVAPTQRTRGIEVHEVSFDDIHVTMWDMAGHDDYHSFHDLVVPNLTGNSGSSCSFFLVCNLLQIGINGHKSTLKGLQYIGDELLYWLRFIASNSQISTAYQPHVTIVLTNLDMVPSDYHTCFLPRIKDKVQSFIDQFQGILDIDVEVFAVNALSTESIDHLLTCMKEHLKKLLGRLPPVFEACSKMQVILSNWNRQHPNQPLVRWNAFAELCDKVEELQCHDEHKPEVSRRKKEVVAASLHDGGHLMYNEELDFVVLNPHWFCHDIIGHVLKCKELGDYDGIANGTITKVDLKHVVSSSLCSNLEEFCFEDLLQMMIKLEFCYEQDGETVLIPTLLQDYNDQSALGRRPLRWPSQEKSTNWHYVGRRMVCNDEARTFLTLGFFPRLQVVFQKLFGTDNGGNSYDLAKNLISFNTRGMEVILENSGQIGFDIDILIRSARANEDVILEFLHAHVMKPIYDLCAHPVLGCQGVNLQEGILRPSCVEGLVPRVHRQHQVVLVEELKRIILASNDYSYVHNWKKEGPLERGYDDAKMLLGKKAWENILNMQLKDMQNICHTLQIDTKYQNLVDDKPNLMDMEEHDFLMDEVKIADVYKLVRRSTRRLYTKIEESEASVLKRLDDMENRITTRMHQISSLQEQVLPQIWEKINDLMAFSEEFRQSHVPRLVYFTACQKNSLRSIVTRMVPGLTNLKMHFMCEHREGFHMIKDQKGCDVLFGTDATRVFRTILVWGMKIFIILAKMGAHLAAGMGSLVPNLARDFSLVLDSPGFLNVRNPPSIQQPIQQDVHTIANMEIEKQEVEQWLIQFLKGKNLSELFSLQKVMYTTSNVHTRQCGSIAWICNDHLKEGQANSTLKLIT